MPRRYSLAATLIIAFISFFALFYFFIFNVKNIKVVSERPCASVDQIIETLKIKDKPILLISVDNLKNQLKSKFPCIDNLQIIKKIPSSVEISYLSKTAVAKINSSGNLIMSDGQVASGATSNDTPTIFLPHGINAQVDQKIDDETVLSALQIADQLLKSDFAPTNIRFVNDSITIYNQQDLVAIFSSKKSATAQTDSLQKVLAKAKIESKKISKIDMRFDNPVIVFK